MVTYGGIVFCSDDVTESDNLIYLALHCCHDNNKLVIHPPKERRGAATCNHGDLWHDTDLLLTSHLLQEECVCV